VVETIGLTTKGTKYTKEFPPASTPRLLLSRTPRM
jgi:hypothetical protein